VIDPYQHDKLWRGIGIRNLRQAGFGDIVELIEEPSHLALARLESEGLSVDFAFIDGAHTFDFVLVDFFFVDRILKAGGIVVFDDADYPSIRRTLRYIVKNGAYRVYGSAGGGAETSKRARGVTGLGRLRRALGRLRPLRRVLSPDLKEADWIWI